MGLAATGAPPLPGCTDALRLPVWVEAANAVAVRQATIHVLSAPATGSQQPTVAQPRPHLAARLQCLVDDPAGTHFVRRRGLAAVLVPECRHALADGVESLAEVICDRL